MNTPSHSILNLAILGRPQQRGLMWPILLGSWWPDAAMFVFYGWAKGRGLAESQIWQEAYYQPGWQDIFAIGNSIPLALLVGCIALWQRWQPLTFFCASALLHHLEDLPLHHDDAHRHFWPLSNVRFISPLSYWDRDHYGTYVALGEILLVLLASVYLWRWTRSRLGRALLIAINLFYLIGYATLYLS